MLLAGLLFSQRGINMRVSILDATCASAFEIGSRSELGCDEWVIDHALRWPHCKTASHICLASPTVCGCSMGFLRPTTCGRPRRKADASILLHSKTGASTLVLTQMHEALGAAISRMRLEEDMKSGARDSLLHSSGIPGVSEPRYPSRRQKVSRL